MNARVRTTLALLALLVVSGCVCFDCDADRLPHRGLAGTPQQLVEIIQYEAQHDCRSELYDLLSQRTQEEHSRSTWWLGLGTVRVEGYRVLDVMARGTYDGALSNPTNEKEAFVYYRYQEPGGRELRLKLFVLREAGWRVGIVDQVKAIETGKRGFWWFDE
jgi:hypothetical protein